MALNRDEIISVVLNRAGNRGNDAVLTGFAKTELNLIIAELEGDPWLPWFLVSLEYAAAITANDPVVSMSVSAIREYEDDAVWYYNSNDTEPTRKRLEKMDLDDLQQLYPMSLRGRPVAYALVGTQIVLGPTPDADAATGTILWRTYNRAVTLSDSQLTNLWTENASFLLVNRLGSIMARQYIRDEKLALGFEEGATRALKALKDAQVAREQANRTAQMGGSDR